MNNYQTQQLFNAMNGIIGFTMSIMVMAFMVGMVRPTGKFFKPLHKPEKHLAKPVVKEVTVPGGSYWKCSTCYKELPPGTKVFKAGKEVYCSVLCIKLPEHHSSTLQQFMDAELGTLVSTYGYPPNGISFEGRDVLGNAIGGHLGGFIFLAEDLKDYWVYDDKKARVLVKYTIAHEYSHLMVLYEGVEKYLPEGIEEKDKEEYLEGIADGFATKWIGFTVEDIDKILEALGGFGRFRERKNLF